MMKSEHNGSRKEFGEMRSGNLYPARGLHYTEHKREENDV